MRAGGTDEEDALRATNRLGDTTLHEAVRHGRAGVVDLFMAEAPELASVTSDDGVSPLYLAVTTRSKQIVRLLLRPSPDGTPSPASAAGRKGRTALHAAAAISKEMIEDILAWEPEGPTLLTRVDSSGRSPLHFAVKGHQLDVAKLFLHVNSSLARISDNEGLFPLHLGCCTSMMDELTKRCPDFYELVDHDGMNLLHVAVVRNKREVVQYICQDDRFTMLLNATDFDGNTPLHLAVKYGYKQIVATLLQTMSVEMNIQNKDGLTPIDVAYIALQAEPSRYFLNQAFMVFDCIDWAGAASSLDIIDVDQGSVSTKDESTEGGYMKGSGTIVSGLIATVTFAAAVTIPGGFIADGGHPDQPGTAVLARRFAFRAFVVSDTMAFLCSIVATCFLIYGGATEVPPYHRDVYNWLASGLVPLAVQFMIAAFAFGFHLVLGAANHGLMVFVYMVSSASVLFCFPGIWVPFCQGFGKAIWRRAGWRGILNFPQHPSSLLQVLCRLLCDSPLVQLRRTLCAVLICVTIVVAIALEFAFPNY